MKLRYECMVCHLKKELALIDSLPDSEAKVTFLKQACGVLAGADENHAAPALTEPFDRVNLRYGFAQPDFTDLKKRYNDMMLDLLPDLRQRVLAAPDPLAEALKIARAGNYIDFGAFSAIDDGKLLQMIERARDDALDPVEYAYLLRDLEGARSLTYVIDNCGEIVLDRLVLERLRAAYPNLALTVLARGGAVCNDATAEDARYAGLDACARVTDTGAALAGCQMELISPQARELLRKSDIIIAKGMGNFETMCECGLPVYYLFLCKCDYFAKRLGVPLMTGIMAHEQRMNLTR